MRSEVFRLRKECERDVPGSAELGQLLCELKSVNESLWDVENELQSVAVVERKVMLAMPDGVRLATDIYRPKNVAKAPTVFVRTPYNFNFWDVQNGVPADMSAQLAAVKRGYAYVVQNERGHFFSEGNYDILGAPRSDGYDAIDWMSKQPCRTGKSARPAVRRPPNIRWVWPRSVIRRMRP